MPTIDTSETEKFQDLTQRFHSKPKIYKHSSPDFSNIISENISTSTPEASHAFNNISNNLENKLKGVIKCDSKLSCPSVLKLDNHMQTISGNHIYLSSRINPDLDLKNIPLKNNPAKFMPPKTVAVQTSRTKIQELKAVHDQLINISKPEPEKPIFTSRMPTLEALKQAIERARKEELEKNQCTSTEDLVLNNTTSESVKKATSKEFKLKHAKKCDKKIQKAKSKNHCGGVKTKKRLKEVQK